MELSAGLREKPLQPVRLAHQTQVEQFEQLGRARHRNGETQARVVDDEPLSVQPADGSPQRRAAHAEQPGQLTQREELAGPQLSLDEPVEEDLIGPHFE